MDFPKSVPGVGLVGGRFVNEDPIAGRAGSLIPAEWGNALTDEVLAVQARAGMSPDEGNVGQLRDAIVWLIRNLIASEEQAGTARIASIAQAQAMADDSVLLTPKKLAGALKGANQSLAASGYQKLPGGVILQWGLSASVAGGPATFTFPIAFPAAMLVRGAFSNDTGGVGIFSTVSTLGDPRVNMGVSAWTSTTTRAGAGLTSWCFALGY